MRLVNASLELRLRGRSASTAQQIELPLGGFDGCIARLDSRVRGGLGVAAGGAVVGDLLAAGGIHAVGARRVHALLQRGLLRFRRLTLRSGLLERGLRLGDGCLGWVVALIERRLGHPQLSLRGVVCGLGLLDIGRRGALEVVHRGIGRADYRLGRGDTRAERVELALSRLEVGGIVSAERGVRRFSAGQRRLVRIDRALSGLLDVVSGPLFERRQPGIGSVERVLRLLHGLSATPMKHQVESSLLCLQPCLGELNVFEATAILHVLELDLLLDERGLGRGHVVGPGSDLERGELRLRAGEIGARLEGADLRAVLLEDGQRVAGLDCAADVHQHLVDSAGGLGQHADLLSGANIAAVGQSLLNVTSRGGLGAHGSRRHGNRDWRRRRRRALTARGDEEAERP